MPRPPTVLLMLLLLTATSSAENGALVPVGEAADVTSESLHELGAESAASATAAADFADKFRAAKAAALAKKRKVQFVATAEWQVIQPGQDIPPGLHVEIDMQTGVKRAKLLDEEIGVKTVSEARAAKVALLKDAIGAVNDDGNSTAPVGERLAQFAKKLAENKAGGIRVRADAEVMTKIIEAIQDDAATDEEIEVLLDELEGFAHQVDNAVDLYSMGGFETVNSFIANPNTTAEIRGAAAKVIGAASQNNPTVQANALKDGVLPRLLSQLGAASQKTETKRTLYAVSALCRQHQDGLEAFTQLDGFDSLAKVMLRSPVTIQASVVRFIGDVAGEHAVLYGDDGDTDIDGPAAAEGSLEQHTHNPELLRHLAETGWCERIVALCELVGSSNPSAQEDVLNTMLGLLPVCSDQVGMLQPTLITVAQAFEASFAEDPDDLFAKELADLTRGIMAAQRQLA